MLMSPAVGICVPDETEAWCGERLIFLQTERYANDVGRVGLERNRAAIVVEDNWRLRSRLNRAQSKRERNHNQKRSSRETRPRPTDIFHHVSRLHHFANPL